MTDYDDMFGFTPDEVERICSDHGHSEKPEEVRGWCGGYTVGDAELLDPRSVMEYVDSGFEPGEYRIDIFGEQLVSTYLDGIDEYHIDTLKVLGEGGTAYCREDVWITYADAKDVGKVSYIMAMCGYFGMVTSDRHRLPLIPNRRMYRLFAKVVMERLDYPVRSAMGRFLDSVMGGDIAATSDDLSSLLTTILDSRIFYNEYLQEMFAAGMLLSLQGMYSMSGVWGKGYRDVFLCSRCQDRPHIMMGFAKARFNARRETMENVSKAAMERIREKEHFHGLKGDVMIYGIAVRGKDVVVSSETVSL